MIVVIGAVTGGFIRETGKIGVEMAAEMGLFLSVKRKNIEIYPGRSHKSIHILALYRCRTKAPVAACGTISAESPRVLCPYRAKSYGVNRNKIRHNALF